MSSTSWTGVRKFNHPKNKKNTGSELSSPLFPPSQDNICSLETIEQLKKKASPAPEAPIVQSCLALCKGSFDDQSVIQIDSEDSPTASKYLEHNHTILSEADIKKLSLHHQKQEGIDSSCSTASSSLSHSYSYPNDTTNQQHHSTNISQNNTSPRKMPSMIKKLRRGKSKRNNNASSTSIANNSNNDKATPAPSPSPPASSSVIEDDTMHTESTVNTNILQYKEDQFEITTGSTDMTCCLPPSPTLSNKSLTRKSSSKDNSSVSGTSPPSSPDRTPTKPVNNTSDETSRKRQPSLSPKSWPQYPLMVRPTPGSGMIIKGVRYAGASPNDYIMKPSQTTTNSDNKEDNDDEKEFICPESCFLPVNNGNEEKNKTMVIDFESPLFVGTAMIRIRNSESAEKFINPNSKTGTDDEVGGYFHDVKRRHQVVLEGRFKTEVPMMECFSGNIFTKPVIVPSGLLIKAGLKLLKYVNPRIQIRLDGVPNPYILSPLGSSPQSVIVNDAKSGKDGNIIEGHVADASIEGELEEPTEEIHTLLHQYYSSTMGNSIPLKKTTSPRKAAKAAAAASSDIEDKRRKSRKKQFDELFTTGTKHTKATTPSNSTLTSSQPYFDKDKVYTFVFYQHHANFAKLEMTTPGFKSLELGYNLDGNCFQIMACQTDDAAKKKLGTCGNGSEDGIPKTIWSFDVWHEKMIK